MRVGQQNVVKQLVQKSFEGQEIIMSSSGNWIWRRSTQLGSLQRGEKVVREQCGSSNLFAFFAGFSKKKPDSIFL